MLTGLNSGGLVFKIKNPPIAMLWEDSLFCHVLFKLIQQIIYGFHQSRLDFRLFRR